VPGSSSIVARLLFSIRCSVCFSGLSQRDGSSQHASDIDWLTHLAALSSTLEQHHIHSPNEFGIAYQVDCDDLLLPHRESE
jgi:hypothetical protein